MAYTTINKSGDYFNTKLYTGNGSTNAITGVGFQPDWSWLKRRDTGESHALYDAVRGVTKRLETNNTGAEATKSAGLTTFGTDGFTLGNDTQANTSGGTYASWNWLGANGTASNTDGSITSTVSANTTSGFSIVSYTGNGSAGATVGHGLGVAPAMVIVKNRTSSSNTWTVYHHKLSAPATKFLGLNLTVAEDTSTGNFNSTVPSSSVITLGTDAGTNGSTNMIAYCFAEKQGYSKFGSYTGNNNSDGSFIYTGFKPAFVMIKDFSEGSSNWVMYDDKRSAVPDANINNRIVFANTSADYEIPSGSRTIDTLSNGFKLRGNSGDINGTASYIYMAFAAAPLVGTNNVPANAR